jgi:NAD(P)-dependent dehydrogenase (short-subunit alcohol dehydrogenase family)
LKVLGGGRIDPDVPRLFGGSRRPHLETEAAYLAQGATVLCDGMEAKYGACPLFIQCDIRDVALLREATGAAKAAHGPVSVLINNAARDDRHTLDALSVEKWDQSIAINLRPHFFTAQAVIPALVATPSAAGGYEIVVDCLPTCLGVNRVQELPISIAAVSSSLSCSIQSSMARSGLPSPGTAVSDSGIERPSRADSHVAAAFKVG